MTPVDGTRQGRASTIVAAAPAALLAAVLALLGSCGPDQPDAYGNFEAREVVVSAEVGGRLLTFEAEEGQRWPAGAVVARIDTTDLALQRAELLARQRAARTRTAEAGAHIDVLRAQLATARDEYERTQRLFEMEAATSQQLVRARGEVRVLEERIQAARAQAAAADEEAGGADARIAWIDEQLAKSHVRNPIGGTVLTTYAEVGEFVRPGSPLYRIADLETMTLRAYVTGAQLASVRVGEPVRVRYDAGRGDLASVPGRVTWVAARAEFTPTPIQTREERADQVYAVTARVPNPDGAIKIGMPGELVLEPAPAP